MRCVERNTADIDNLKQWQTAQNGSLKRIEAKVDGLITWMMRAALGLICSAGLTLVMFVFKVILER
jgi:hypothetical protein